jgi:uncharacterized protein HemY
MHGLQSQGDCSFRARAMESCGRMQDAWRLLQAAIAEHPSETDLHIALGDIALKHKQYAPAISSYERAVTALRRGPHNISRLREIENRLRIARKESTQAR